MRVPPLSIMGMRDAELESRLDDLLSRIATETQEIKELEQQLTSQSLANEALQRDVQEVICGLQEYLGGLRQQARRSKQQVDVLQAENQSLQRLLEDAQRHCSQLEDTQQEELSALWKEAQALRSRQVELEEGLQQLREELTQQQQDPDQPRRICLQDANQRLQVLLDQSRARSNQTRTQLERFTAGLSELQENRREPKVKVSSKDRSTQENRASRQEPQQGQNQIPGQNHDRPSKEALQRPRCQSRTGPAQQNQAPSLASQGTQDSGVGLQYLGSADRGRSAGEAETPGPAEGVSGPQGPLRVRLLCGPPGGGAATPCSDQQRTDGWQQRRFVSKRLFEAAAKKKKKHHHHHHHRSDTDHPRVERATPTQERVCRSALQVCDDLACLEETLLQRRAELRQADRLLLEAQRCRRTTRRDADRLQHRLEDSSACLLEATQHLRELREEEEQLRRKRRNEEDRLREVEEKLRSRQEELQRLGSKIHRAGDRLTELLSSCQGAQEHLDSLTCQEARRQEELQAAEDGLKELREEEQRLVRAKAELSSHKAELKQVLQELLLEQEVLEEVKTRRSQTLQQLQRKQEALQKMREDLLSMKAEAQDTRKELTELQQEVASCREAAASSLADRRQQRAALQEVQQELGRRKEELSVVQEQCRHLEARRRHADRSLSALEAELSKKRAELSHTQTFKQGVVGETRANQQELSSSRPGTEEPSGPAGLAAPRAVRTTDPGNNQNAAHSGSLDL
ncbi:centriolin isoform X4 [Fundulus heteroclitus]|uniref:centriolin isoform X4 n=1 Tax=Fundulus heteroclitus TaxID=8078 RepID=UPI00165CA86F|nr:centriolin isoform X4 [Fundulus heteroclitus]